MTKTKFPIYQIGVMASEKNTVDKVLRQKAGVIGKEIARHGHILITGGGTKGVPLFVAQVAKSNGGRVIGICPGFNPSDFRNQENKNLFDVVIQTGLSSSRNKKNSIGFDYLNINSSDAVIFIGGNSGTLAEFIIASKADKVIGVLTDSGGMNEFFEKIIDKNSKQKIIRNSDPKILVQSLLNILYIRHRSQKRI